MTMFHPPNYQHTTGGIRLIFYLIIATLDFGSNLLYTQHKASWRVSAPSGGKTPTQHALFLQHVSGMAFVNPEPTASSDPSVNTQAEFDYLYLCALALLN